MANDTTLLEKDEILNALIFELEQIKLSSNTLQNAGKLVNGAVEASNNLIDHSSKMLDLVRNAKDGLQLEVRSLQDFIASGEKRNSTALEKLDDAIAGIETHDKELARALGEIRQLVLETLTVGMGDLKKSQEERAAILEKNISTENSKVGDAILELQKEIASVKSLSAATLVIMSIFIGVLVYIVVKIS